MSDGSYFDKEAATWDDDPAKVRRAEVVAAAIAQAVPLDRSTRVLEYGAGTGLVSQALRDAVGPLTLVDTSAGMREVMLGKVASGLLPGARVWDVDLATQSAPEETFDLLVTVMVLHHVEDVDAALANFRTLVAPGGHIAIADLEAEDGSFHGDDFHGHHGFDPTALRARMERAGFAQVALARCHEVVRPNGTFPMFLATGVRP